MKRLDPLRNFLFRCRHLYRGAPILVQGESFRVDESLRRWQVRGEDWILDAMRTRLVPGDDVIDVGANFGLHTLFAGRRVAPAGRVVAFEPIPANLALLRRNVVLNGMVDRVTIAATAVSDSVVPSLRMHVVPGRHDLTASLRPGDGVRQTINVANTLLDSYRFPRNFSPRLIKVDVEGAELAVLRSARRILEQFQPLLLIEVHGFALPNFGDSTGALDEFIATAGYREIGRNVADPTRSDYFHLLCQHRTDRTSPRR